MKQGWEIKKLGEVCEIVGGSTPKTTESSYWDGEHYWVTPAVLDGAKYISSTSRTITDAGVKSAHLQLLPIGTVLLSSRAPIGKVAITTVPMYCNQGFKNLICSDKLYNEFAYWFLYHNTEYLNSLGTGATFKEISKRVVEQISIPIPPYAEQERIVEILDREFERIDALKANAEQNLQHAKDLFQSALKQELQPKEGWIVSTLQALLRLTSGDNLTAKSIVQGEYPVYGGNGIMGYHNQYNLDGLNVIVGRVGALCGNVRLVKGKIWYTDNAFLVHDKENVFYLPYLTYELQRADLRQYATQAAQPVVSNASMKDVVLAAPATKEEQELIVARLDKLKEHCKTLEENYTKTIALCDDMKQALLRKAFNGEL